MMLNLNKAVKLYNILNKHLPDNNKELDSLSYVQHIVESIKDKNPRDYVDAVMIMNNMSFDELKKKDSNEILDLFIEGLSENKFVSLCDFIGSFGYGGQR